MRDLQTLYTNRLCSPEQAVSGLRSDSDIAMGMALGEPPALLTAMANRISQTGMQDVRLWYFHSMSVAAKTVLQYDMMGQVIPHCMFLGATERELMTRGDSDGRKCVNFVPVAFSEAPRLLSQQVKLDAFLTTVSPMDRHGYFSFGTNNDYASTAARSAQYSVVEVNPQMPRVFGDSMIHISEVDAVVENDVPLHETPVREPSVAELQISEIVGEMVTDGACLQMGIGALPQAVCGRLRQRSDLGVHTELLSPGLVDLLECGAVSNRRKATYPGRTIFTFALGTRRMYDLIDDNPAIRSQPVNIVNDPRHIGKNRNVVSINATLQVDLLGACNSESIRGREYSGSGGQLDFVRGARASKGGRSIIACCSTAKKGTVSRIVPALTGPVTTPRNDVDTVVTEIGSVSLFGLSDRQRAEALIEIAHPDHRAELRNTARGRLVI